MSLHPDQQWISITEAATHVGCSRQTLHKYINLGHLTTYKAPTGMIRLRRSDVDSLFTRDGES